MNKILKILKLLIKVKFFFYNPPKSNLIVFDEHDDNFNNLLLKFNYFFLRSRIENIDKIYISFKILKLIFKNYRGNLMTAYLSSIIEIVSPKVILTYIDNSYKFSELAKLMEKKYTFIAIQNGVRLQINEFNYLMKKKKINYNDKIYLPNFLCFGNYEKFLYKKNKIKVKNIISVGSLALANFIEYKKKYYFNKKTYDICLMSEVDSWQANLNILNLEEGFAKLTKYIIKFCKNHDTRLVLCLKRHKTFLNLDDRYSYYNEQRFYQKYLLADEYEFIKKNFLFKGKSRFSSYKCMSESEVVVGTVSTMLRENLAMGGKILSCNLTPTNIYDFPIKGVCFIKNCTYNEFEKRLLLILSIKKSEYYSRIINNGDYNMFFRKKNSTIKKIRDELSNYLFIK
jgi:surface carbohydrate biosynthesis protein